MISNADDDETIGAIIKIIQQLWNLHLFATTIPNPTDAFKFLVINLE
jgi:hypothetical protein